MRDRVALAAQHIKVLADVDVKHSAPLAPRAIEDEVDDALRRGLADALIVSGTATGKATDLAHLQRTKSAAAAAPVFVGSGVSAQTIQQYLAHADGFIIGTAFKKDADPNNPVEPHRVERIMAVVT
jgi:membrane complex biogenesis BtpA family protein